MGISDPFKNIYRLPPALDAFERQREVLRTVSRLSEVMTPWHMRQVNELQGNIAVQSALMSRFVTTSPWSALGEISKGLDAYYRVSDQMRHISALTQHNGLLRQIELMQRFDRGLSRLLPMQEHRLWNEHMRHAVLPSLGLLGSHLERPFSLMIGAAGRDFGAVFARITGSHEAPRLSLAAMVNQSIEKLPVVTVEVQVSCKFCGELLAVPGEFRWAGSRRRIINLEIVPTCSECARRQLDDPGYYQRCIDAMSGDPGPSLMVFDGDQAGDGQPRAHLRIVRLDEPPASDGDDG